MGGERGGEGGEGSGERVWGKPSVAGKLFEISILVNVSISSFAFLKMSEGRRKKEECIIIKNKKKKERKGKAEGNTYCQWIHGERFPCSRKFCLCR